MEQSRKSLRTNRQKSQRDVKQKKNFKTDFGIEALGETVWKEHREHRREK